MAKISGIGQRGILHARLASAWQARADGRLDEATQLCDWVLDRTPWSTRARYLKLLLKISQICGNWAIAQFQTAAQGGRLSARSASALVIALKKQQRLLEAECEARKAVTSNSGDPELHYLLGLCLMALDRSEEAEAAIEAAVAITARSDYLSALGHARRKSGRLASAIEALQQASVDAAKPNEIRAYLAEMLLEDGQTDAAASHAESIVAHEPRSIVGHRLLAKIALARNLYEEAERQSRLASEIDPFNGRSAAVLGSVLQINGKFDEADSVSRRAIELEPRQGLAYFNLTRSRTFSQLEEGEILEMTRLAEDEALVAGDRCLLRYALGKAYEDTRRYAHAMAHYDEANRLAYSGKFGNALYDTNAAEARLSKIRNTFTSRFISIHDGFGLQDDIPIFVVGMMRSGTTLVEQILSSHPAVGGAGEQRFWVRNSSAVFNDSSDGLDRTRLQELCRIYLENLQATSPDRRYVVDKMPANYLQLGLIHLAFPNAKIVHISRNPYDTCVSIYSTENPVRLPWAHNRANIAHNYLLYERLMEHWREVLPGGRFIEVQYEELVSNPSVEIPRLIKRCGLSWSDGCLQPENNTRPVATPSLFQVTHPISKSSIGRYCNFLPWIEDMSVLGPPSSS